MTANERKWIPFDLAPARPAIELPKPRLRPSERARTFEALTGAWHSALRIPTFQLHKDRYIILSDVHKGDGKPRSDDFLHNRDIYLHALNYYRGGGYRLVLNGDIEEGWKAPYSAIIDAYESDVFAVEREFAREGHNHYLRIYGNHDEDWADPQRVRRHLWPALGHIQVHPAVVLGNRIFIVHGHQGDMNADRLSWISRRIVRHLWRPLQNTFEVSSLRAAENNLIRRRRDQNLYEWARASGLLLIAGHTHRAMFESCACQDQQIDATTIRAANYLNDGCCVHTDCITGIEIDRGEIRLIRWDIPACNVTPQRQSTTPPIWARCWRRRSPSPLPLSHAEKCRERGV